jgi:hypothetical protein
MQRLVYSPKIWCFIKRRNGNIADVSRYVTSGDVQRRLNAASTAEITLRNPNRLFTAKNGEEAAFYPMDPVTIYLQRLKNRPVRVFTGYLDETPYYQMYPGTITLSASCTLKRLLHTYFDPALPYTINFLTQYGWIPDGQGNIFNPAAQSGTEPADGGMGKLLYVTMNEIGGWKKKNIKIEQLPKDLIKRMGKLFRTFEADNAEATAELENLIENLVGSTAYGESGGDFVGSIGGGSAPQEFVDAANKWGQKYNIDPAIILGIADEEQANWGDKGVSPVGAQGYTQFMPATRNAYLAKYGVDAWGSVDEALHATALYLRDNGYKQGDTTAIRASIFAYNHADWYVSDVLNKAKSYRTVNVNENTASGRERAAAERSYRATRRDGRAGKAGSTQGTRLDAIIAEANRLNALSLLGMQYNNARPPSDAAGYDCSSSCDQLLKTAGYNIPDWPATSTIKQYMRPGVDPTGRLTFWNSDKSNVGGNNVHIFATINGRDWGTNNSVSPNGGPSWHVHTKDGFDPFHVDGLDDPASIPGDSNTNVPGGTTTGTSDSNAQIMSQTNAAVLAASFNLADALETAEATALQGNKSLMNDKPLMPFIQQICEGSLRQFQSMPNGDFFAFYPDYFGETFHRPPYWIIDDIEVLNGGVNLSDENLITHEYVVGDTQWGSGNSLANKLLSSGTVSVINAFVSDITTRTGTEDSPLKKGGNSGEFHAFDRLLRQDEAVQFLSRYGARPHLEEFPAIRSHWFELFLAYQHFMQAWARQFLTPFELTFMPELYPGGKVGFPEHGLQMYIEEVTHTFDYESGFTTAAQMSAPAAMVDANGKPLNPNLPSNMPTALLEAAVSDTNDKSDRPGK